MVGGGHPTPFPCWGGKKEKGDGHSIRGQVRHSQPLTESPSQPKNIMLVGKATCRRHRTSTVNCNYTHLVTLKATYWYCLSFYDPFIVLGLPSRSIQTETEYNSCTTAR